MAGSITARIRGRLDQFHGAHAQIARVVLADPTGASAMSIKELAAAAGVSQATVSRFCSALGLAGYPELRLALAADSDGRDPKSVPQGDISASDDLRSVVSKITRLDAQAVTDTAELLDIATLEKTIDALSAARRIDVYGVGASGIVGEDLAQKLRRIGRTAIAFQDAHTGLTSAAVLGPEDLAVAVSHSGTTDDTLDMLRTAKDRGAATVAITNNAQSALAREADQVLLTAAHESVFRSGATASRLAQLVVIDCMFIGLAQRTFSASQAALESTLTAIRDRPRRQPVSPRSPD